MNNAYWVAWVEIDPITKYAKHEWEAYFTSLEETLSEAMRLLKLPYVGKVAIADIFGIIYDWSNVEGNLAWKRQ